MGNKEGSSAELVEKKQACILWLKEMYSGFEDYEYDVAMTLGNIDYWNNMERDVVELNGFPYLWRGGKTLHEIFVKRVIKYLNHQDFMKRGVFAKKIK